MDTLVNKLSEIMAKISKEITSDGLLPELVGRNEDGFNSEIMGYGMRLSLCVGNKRLFLRLLRGVQAFGRTKEGLVTARIYKNKTVDIKEGVSWADSNQDIATALIEAGEKWNDSILLNQGLEIANTFLKYQTTDAGKFRVVTPDVANRMEKLTGSKIRRVNLSLFNFRLYQLMERRSDDTDIWRHLKESGFQLINLSLKKYCFPPDNINLLNGKMVSNRELLKWLKAKDKVRALLAKTILTEKEVFGFDAIRIPWRLCDGISRDSDFDNKAVNLASIIYERLVNQGGVKTKYFADGTIHAKGEVAAVAAAPFLRVLMLELKDKQEILDLIDSYMTTADNTVMYWLLWRGLGYAQIMNLN